MWDVFKEWIFDIIQFFYGFCLDWGMAIIVVTIIFRLLVAPLMHLQARSSYQMQKMQPKIQELQEKFADDRIRLGEETQKLYAEAKFNPLIGCLPILLQMPIFIALFQVLREMGSRVEVQDFRFYNLVPDLVAMPSTTFSQGFMEFLPYLILMLIFAGATFFPMIQQQLQNKNNPQRNQTLIMGVVMTLMMLWLSWSSPAGVLLFWGTSSLIGIAQNQLTLAICRRQDERQEKEEALVSRPIEVNVVRKAKKKRPKKSH